MPMKMGSFCDICNLHDKEETPTVHCLQCQQMLCSSCDKHHSDSSVSRNHNIVQVEDYYKVPKFFQNLVFKCSMHCEKFEYYCRNDDKLICTTCKDTSHKKCLDTPLINDVIQSVKSSFLFEDTHTNLRKLHTTLQTVVEDRQQNLICLQTQRNELLDHIKETRRAFLII